MRNAVGLNSPRSSRTVHRHPFMLPALLAIALCWTQILAAQTPAPAAPASPAHKVHHRHKPAAVAMPKSKTAEAAPAAPVAAAPSEPQKPLWPANEKPLDAAVTWDSHGLYINAANSSLQQILQDVATMTGATLEGPEADQRVFGVYGPGKARDVLSQLLQGTSYNVIMIGDQGAGTPREIVLSARSTTATAAAAKNPVPASDDTDDTEADDQSQADPPPYTRPGFGPQGPRTPHAGQPPNNPQ